MEKKVKLDPNKIEYDGNGFRIVIKDETAFEEKIEKLRKQVIEDIFNKQPENKVSDEVSNKNVALPENEQLG